MHDQLVRMMDHKDGALALAFRHMALYYPSAMLKGGGGLVDLPGLNAASVIEQLESRNGVTASSTGAVVVMLDKTLGAAREVLRKLKGFCVLRQALGGGHAARKHVIFLYNRARPLGCHMPRACAESRGAPCSRSAACARASDRISAGAPCVRAGEKEDRDLLVEDLPVAGWDEIVEKDRKQWKNLLKGEAQRINKTPGEQPVADADIDEVVRRTTMLPVYPMLHLSAMLNRSARPADAAKADEHSGIRQLIRSIEAINYEVLLGDVVRLCQRALPQFVSSLRATLKDATANLPEELVDLANKMLKGKRKNEAFKLRLKELETEVEQKFSAARSTLFVNKSAFLRTDESIYAPLHAARADQLRGWQALERKMGTLAERTT
jgi:hypothetical protein